MPTFDIVKKSQPELSFRVSSIIGKFDLQSEKIVERFQGDIDLPTEWKIGLIVGKSGTGTPRKKPQGPFLTEEQSQ